MKAAAYVWCNSSDPDLYGEWDFEVAVFCFLNIVPLSCSRVNARTRFSLHSIVSLVFLNCGSAISVLSLGAIEAELLFSAHC